MKRKFDEVQESGFSVHVDTQNEITALRDLVSRQRKRVTDLLAELEQERSASASATSEAMSMILRLQREKAEVQMEARQYKRFSEEKMAHDQQEIVILEKYLHALSCEVRISRNRLISHGVNPDEDDDSEFCDHPFENYPLLKCCPNLDAEKCSTSESSPNRKEDLQDLERRVLHLEQIPSHGIPSNEGEECAFMSPSPSNCELLSTVRNQKQQEEFLMAFEGDSSSDLGAEEENNIDRIYTVDAVHSSTPTVQVCKEQLRTPTEFIIGDREETDLRKLYVRLQALEADRESMKQAIMSMQTEKAQVLLKEIAQQIYGDAQPSTRPVRKLVKKQSLFGRFSLMSAVKVKNRNI